MLRACQLVAFVLLSLQGLAQVTLVRGPYLQAGTSSQVTIRWRTDRPSSSQVNIGHKPGTYFKTIRDETLRTNHEIIIDGLSPDTKYFYAIISGNRLLQGDDENTFTTYPAAGSTRLLRFWVTGDCGNNSDNQRKVRDQYLAYIGKSRTDGWLLLGDNAYPNGTEDEYQHGFFDQYQTNIMKSTVLWPATGNHDYANNPELQVNKLIPYYTIFTIPTAGEAGGVASNSESYYSYTIGNVHFIALDSYGVEDGSLRMYDTLSPQIQWLKKDLASNDKFWTIAYWHHPPYTKGSHDSDNEEELVLIRRNLLRILERNNIDLVLSGHSHSYERTRLIKGHYDLSSTFNLAKHNGNETSSGRYDGSDNSCPFVKQSGRSGEGIIYVVAGSAGQFGGDTPGFPHPAMVHSDRTTGGSVIIEVDANRLDLLWLNSAGTVADRFTMMKNVGVSVTNEISQRESAILTASWVGEYRWDGIQSTYRSVEIMPDRDKLYVVSDESGCIKDSITMIVSPVTSIERQISERVFKDVYPNPADDRFFVEFEGEGYSYIILRDALGRTLDKRLLTSTDDGCRLTFDRKELNLPNGTYYLTAFSQRKTQHVKIVLR